MKMAEPTTAGVVEIAGYTSELVGGGEDSIGVRG